MVFHRRSKPEDENENSVSTTKSKNKSKLKNMADRVFDSLKGVIQKQDTLVERMRVECVEPIQPIL